MIPLAYPPTIEPAPAPIVTQVRAARYTPAFGYATVPTLQPQPSFLPYTPQLAQYSPTDLFTLSPAALPTPTAAYLTFNDLPKIPPADVLIVLAHPDDEIFLSGTMVKLAKAGKTIQTVYVTNGKAGEDVSGQQLTGDALGMARSAEVSRALADLGINRPPMVLDFMDGQTSSQSAGIQAQLRQILRQIQPKEILVHDVTGHPDHKNVNTALVRELNNISMGQSPTDYNDRQILAPLFQSGNVYAAVVSPQAQPTFKQALRDKKWEVMQFQDADMRVYTGDVTRMRAKSLSQHSTQYGQPDMHGLQTFYKRYPYEEFKRLNIMSPGIHSTQRYNTNPFLLDSNNGK